MIIVDELNDITKRYGEGLDSASHDIDKVIDLILSNGELGTESYADIYMLRINLAKLGNSIGSKVKRYDLEYKKDCMLLKKSPSYESLKTIKAKDEQVFLDTYDIKLALVDLKQLHLRAQDELNYLDNIISIINKEGVFK